MLSEMHDTNFISFWLSEWIRKGASIPDEYVCDMSLALLGAGVIAFTKQSTLSLYIDYLYQMHLTGCPPDPGCFIRIDIEHFVKNVSRCKPLATTRRKVRDFYIRCVALLIKTKTLEDAKFLVHAIVVVALSKTEGKICKIPPTKLKSSSRILERFPNYIVFVATIVCLFESKKLKVIPPLLNDSFRIKIVKIFFHFSQKEIRNFYY